MKTCLLPEQILFSKKIIQNYAYCIHYIFDRVFSVVDFLVILTLFNKGSHYNFSRHLSDGCCSSTLNFTRLHRNISICFVTDSTVDYSFSTESFLWNCFAVNTIQTSCLIYFIYFHLVRDPYYMYGPYTV